MSDRKPAWDVIVPREPTEDGKGVRGVRIRPDGAQVVTFRPLADGTPLLPGRSILRTNPRPDGALDVIETLHDGSAGGMDAAGEDAAGDVDDAGEAPASRSGPPQVASDAYREGYDAIDWGASRRGQDPHGAN